jgi:hypothetical protein
MTAPQLLQVNLSCVRDVSSRSDKCIATLQIGQGLVGGKWLLIGAV